MSKQKLPLIIGLCLIAIAMVGGTSAYFATVERAHNVITTTGVAVEIIETAIDDAGHVVPFQNIVNALPGQSYSKRPQVKNIDTGSAWVRMRVETSATKDGDTIPIPDGVLTVDYDTTAWIKSGDYYYYHTQLETDRLTEPLFTTATIASDIPKEYENSTFNLTVTVEAVQVANNGNSAFEATGWTEE